MIITEPKFEFIRNTLRIRLIEDWLFDLEGLTIIHPKTFETDLASIPRIFHPIISPFGDLRYGAIPHDFGYQHNYLLSPYSPNQVYNIASLKMREKYPDLFGPNIPVYIGKGRKFFDKLFRHINIEAATERKTLIKIKANIAYGILRPCGIFAWNEYRSLGPIAYNENSLKLPGA